MNDRAVTSDEAVTLTEHLSTAVEKWFYELRPVMPGGVPVERLPFLVVRLIQRTSTGIGIGWYPDPEREVAGKVRIRVVGGDRDPNAHPIMLGSDTRVWWVWNLAPSTPYQVSVTVKYSDGEIHLVEKVIATLPPA